MQILFVLAFALTSAIAAPFAMCQHADARAHAAALTSGDKSEVLSAQIEDSADAALEEQASLAEAAAGVLAAVLLPETAPSAFELGARGVAWLSAAPAKMVGRALRPLLTPPLR